MAMAAPLTGSVTPQKLRHQQHTHTPDHAFRLRLEDASPETEKVITYLRDLKQTNSTLPPSTHRRTKPQSLPFSVKDSITSSNPNTTRPPHSKGPQGNITITVCKCTSINSPSKSSTSDHTTKCLPSKPSSSSANKENINPNTNTSTNNTRCTIRIPNPHSKPRQQAAPVKKQPESTTIASSSSIPTTKRPDTIHMMKKEDKTRKEGPNPRWDMQLQQVKVRQVKCDRVPLYPAHVPYALVYVFS